MKAKLLSVAVSLAFVVTASSAYADIFNVLGTFSDGGTLTGLLNLDASATPTAGSLVARSTLPINPPARKRQCNRQFRYFFPRS